MSLANHDLEAMDGQVQRLRDQVEATQVQLQNLKLQLQQAELDAEAARHVEQAYRGGFPADWIGETLSALEHSGSEYFSDTLTSHSVNTASQPSASRWPMSAGQYQRYGRQMIMPEIGLHGQLRLRNAKVLVVGVGGLGCPAATYLAGAGVNTLGLMDGDTVDASNLHRQIAHSTKRVGMSKVESAYEFLRSLNPEVIYNRHIFHLSPEQAIPIFEQYDIVLDCTDHPTSRYLISDACVLTRKPLVSASALKTEGQLMVLNDPPSEPGDGTGGPCYRCIFPKPPPAESIQSCGEGGILGPVVGVMGVLQALEAIKLLTRKPNTESGMDIGIVILQESARASLLMFSAYNNPQFRTVRLRSRRADCAVCSVQATVTRQSLSSGSLDYIAFCGLTTPLNLLPSQYRISAGDFARLPRDGSNVLIDTRDETQYAICALRGSINVPWTGDAETWVAKARQTGVLNEIWKQTYVVCRYGNDSQLAVKALVDHTDMLGEVKDIKDGFKAWRQEVDSSWPDY